MAANDKRHNLFAALIDVVLFKIGGVDKTSALNAVSGTNTGDNATNTTSNAYADAKVANDLTASTTVAPSKTAVNTALADKADLVAGKVPAAQLPSYVDDVEEYANLAAFPVTGETGKIYVAIDTNLTYRWTGSVYSVLDPSLALGETSTTAYRGDRGKTAYDHSQLTTGNPHAVTKSDVGLGNVDNTSNATERDAARTLTNARVTPRYSEENSNVAPSINTDNVDDHIILAQAADMTGSGITWTGTPTRNQRLGISITPTGGVRQLIFDTAKFEESESQLFPTETFGAGLRMDMAFKYNNASGKFRLLSVS